MGDEAEVPPGGGALRVLRSVLPSAALLGVLAACGGDCALAGARPNVLVVVMDTTRGDRCSVNGYERPTTPGLEEFARDAVTFRNAWSPAPWTPPSHASLFTGLRPEHHGLLSGIRAYLPDDRTVTLAERLGGAGWATAAFNNNPHVKRTAGLLQGFDRCEHFMGLRDVQYPTAMATHAAALEWVREVRASGRPFFLFINDMEPHGPYTPPRQFEQQFVRGSKSARLLARARAFQFPEPLGANLGQLEVPHRLVNQMSDLYDAEIATLDRELSTLLDALEADGILDDTLVVITSDHGENFAEHGLLDHMFSAHRTVLHIPMIVRFPGRFDGGRVVDDVVRLEDVAPTVLEACGLPVPEGLDGRSLGSELEGRVARGVFGTPASLLRLRHVYPGAPTNKFDRSIRSAFDGRYHLIAYSDGDVELYDVPSDPLERENLASRRRADVQRLWPLLPELR